jgi:hypothetical protein
MRSSLADTLVCASCGHDNREGAKFCEECGLSLAAARAPAKEQRKTVTVLFCDVTGSTALGETLDPERLRALLALRVRSRRPVKVLALQVELCSPRLLVSRADARWRPSGFQPGFWPQGQLNHSTPLVRRSRFAA